MFKNKDLKHENNILNNQNKPIIKNHSKKFKKIKIIGSALLLGITAISSTYFTTSLTQELGSKMETQEVNEALEYYGGVNQYLKQGGLLGTYTKFETENTNNIRVGLDNSVNDINESQISLCINYLNEIFNVINPNYHFNIVRVENEKDCDILIQIGDNFEKGIVGYATDRKNYNIFEHFKNNFSRIVLNKAINDKYEYTRIVLLHELMHVILLSDDLTYNEAEEYNHSSVPFSVLSYTYYYKMMNIGYCPEDYNEDLVVDDNLKNYLQNEFVSYTPFDIAAFAARYGDFTNEENKKNCTKLIVDTYKNCKKIFGDNFNYFLSGTELNNEGYPVKFEKYIKEENSLYSTYDLPKKLNKNIEEEFEL